MTTYKLYCDLDGCVADFLKEVSAIIHALIKGDIMIFKNQQEVDVFFDSGADAPLDYVVSKSMGRKLSKYLAEFGHRHLGDEIHMLSPEETKKSPENKTCRSLVLAVAGQDSFFRNLEPINNGLWEVIKNVPLEILTATVGHYGYEDKPWWVRNVLESEVPVNVVESRHSKVMFADANTILIDDDAETIEDWNSQGGVGILFTGDNTEEVVIKLQELGVL